MRVVAAMSGGVDSSVAAALMIEGGHEVVGATLKLWSCDLDPDGPAPRACCGRADVEEAAAVARALGVVHHVVDGRSEFVENVVHACRDVQAAGLTPNPCVLCNDHLKFGLLLDWASTQGASMLVTGHYASVDRAGPVPGLLRGADRSKDQSYFLFTLAGDERLSFIDFPVGGMAKAEVRRKARALGLPVADKRESQDLCFRAATGCAGTPGDIVDLTGNVLGRHGGLCGYTVGQRRGVGVPTSRRLYVVALRPDSNQVVVGGQEDLLCRTVRASAAAWDGPVPVDPVEVTIRIRYRQEPVQAVVRVRGGEILANLREPQRAVTPGQALVCYGGERLLGGGWIVGS